MPDADPTAPHGPSPRSTPPTPARARRAAVAALDDRALVAAMREGDEHAWAEFVRRFRPILRAHAARVSLTPGLTDADVTDAMVDDLLADEGARLTAPHMPAVPRLAPYLLRAARHRLVNLKRGASRRTRWTDAAADWGSDSHDGPHRDGFYHRERVVAPLCSAFARRAAWHADAVHEPLAPPDDTSDDTPVAARLGAALCAALTPQEQQVLAWIAERVPYRTIAAWLGVGYEAAAKRIGRLLQRLRAAAVDHAERAPGAERPALTRFLRRAGALPPLVSVALTPLHTETPTTAATAVAGATDAAGAAVTLDDSHD